jgi:23S rRNA pseudouridine2604 synthase
MNRQIRRMCSSFGYSVISLKRIRIMNVLLGELPSGEYRKLTKEEIRGIKEQIRQVQTEVTEWQKTAE